MNLLTVRTVQRSGLTKNSWMIAYKREKESLTKLLFQTLPMAPLLPIRSPSNVSYGRTGCWQKLSSFSTPARISLRSPLSASMHAIKVMPHVTTRTVLSAPSSQGRKRRAMYVERHVNADTDCLTENVCTLKFKHNMKELLGMNGQAKRSFNHW